MDATQSTGITDSVIANKNMRRIPFFSIIYTSVLAFSISLPVQAQDFGRVGKMLSQGTSYHVFAKPGEATVQVLVLGSVGAAGVYEVGVGTELDQLLALTGGTPMARTETSKTSVTVRLFREGGGRRDLVYEVSLERMLAEPDLYPPLQDGDVFTIETITTVRTRFGWRDVFTDSLSQYYTLGLDPRLGALKTGT